MAFINSARGRLEGCDVYENESVGVQIETGSDPVLLDCKCVGLLHAPFLFTCFFGYMDLEGGGGGGGLGKALLSYPTLLSQVLVRCW